MAEQAISNLDVFFRVWAVAGPLLVGAASQIWGRRSKIEDREFEKKKDFELKDFALNKEAMNNEKREAKLWYVKFMSSAHEYIGRNHDYKCETDREDLQLRAAEARDQFVTNLNGVVLVGSEDVEEAAQDFFGATIEVTDIFGDTAERSGKFTDFDGKRSKFITVAKGHLRDLDSSNR